MREYKTAISAAVAYIATCDRTENQVRERLSALGFGSAEIEECITELYDSLLLNDEEFAVEYVRSKLAVKPISRRALLEKLKAHKLSEEHILAAMTDFTDEVEYNNAYEEAKSFVLNYMRDIATQNDRKLREKLLRRLISHGYSFDTAKRAMGEALRL